MLGADGAVLGPAPYQRGPSLSDSVLATSVVAIPEHQLWGPQTECTHVSVHSFISPERVPPAAEG